MGSVVGKSVDDDSVSCEGMRNAPRKSKEDLWDWILCSGVVNINEILCRIGTLYYTCVCMVLVLSMYMYIGI